MQIHQILGIPASNPSAASLTSWATSCMRVSHARGAHCLLRQPVPSGSEVDAADVERKSLFCLCNTFSKALAQTRWERGGQ